MKYKKTLPIIVLLFVASLFVLASHTNGEPSQEAILGLQSTQSAQQITHDPPTGISFGLPFGKNLIREKIESKSKLHFLLLGYGGENHSGGYLTDTIILGEADFSANRVNLVNIPRDMWINGQKINSLYAYRKSVTDCIKGVEQIVGINIDAWAMMDFNGFRKMIDELGGIQVDVEKAFDDYEYPRHDDDTVDAGIMHIRFDQGMQHMSGERALQYARSRHSSEDGGDFNRSKRQQQILLALKNEATQAKNLLHFFNLVKILQAHFSSNLTVLELWSLITYAQDASDTHIETKVLSTDNYLYSTYSSWGAYILLPRNGTYSEIRRYLNFSD